MTSDGKTSVLRFGDCELLLDRHEVRREGVAQAVAPQVFALLQYLTRHRDRLVEKDELIAYIWAGRAVSDSSLSTCVKLARQAIGDDGTRQDLIRTVPRVGYRFVGKVEHAGGIRPEPAMLKPTFEPVRPEKMAYQLPDKPSIAVLPFDNMSSEPATDFLADGLSENIIAALSAVPELFVIARNSSFTYKGQATKVQKVAEDLGVRYLLEGSVQQSGDRIRVTAQLIDAIAGHHLWSERFDRNLSDIFAVQDDITLLIAASLRVELTEGESARLGKGSAQNLAAWSNAVKARTLFNRYTKSDNAEARRLYQEALALDPDYRRLHVSIGWTHFIDARFGYSDSFPESFRLSMLSVNKALSLDADSSLGHSLLGALHLLQNKHDLALAEGRLAISLAPSIADNYAVHSISTYYAGAFKETLTLIKEAMRLSPHFPVWFLHRAGTAHMMLGQYDEAIAALETATKSNPSLFRPQGHLAAALCMAGRLEDARSQAAKMLSESPTYTTAEAAKGQYFKDPKHLEKILGAMREAGIPD